MELQSLLNASRATEEFKSEVRRYFEGHDSPRIELVHRVPRIKVQRLIMHLLEAEPQLEVERIRVDARSGCSDFVGTVRVEAKDAVREFEFTWCCRWRAQQAGYRDFFGFPDQIRAAEEFKWRCFKLWRPSMESVA
jgi:hypothetical protein